ncbi:hypothetical protein LXL04_012431 [Taraxacum kok-saghyz]
MNFSHNFLSVIAVAFGRKNGVFKVWWCVEPRSFDFHVNGMARDTCQWSECDRWYKSENLSNRLFGPVEPGTCNQSGLEEGPELISGLRSLRNLNEVSLSNKLSGPVYQSFVENIPANAVVDLSFNALTGQIPQMMSLSNQKEEYFVGNLDLCGKPLKKMCRIPSSHSIPTNVSSDGSATAAEFGEVTWVLLGRR